jgi:hypothetical protein
MALHIAQMGPPLELDDQGRPVRMFGRTVHERCDRAGLAEHGEFAQEHYSWAFSKPVRKVFYNITITGLVVAVALVIGTIEVGGLAASELHLSGPFWNWFENIHVNSLGFVIVGMFVATWAVALSVWRFGHIEERWNAPLSGSPRLMRKQREIGRPSRWNRGLSRCESTDLRWDGWCDCHVFT